MAGEAREKCGVGGILLTDPELGHASDPLQYIMFNLQNRGNEAAGMATKSPDTQLNTHREKGLVRGVFTQDVMAKLVGTMAISQVMYSVSYANHEDRQNHYQPIYDPNLGASLVHNGNIVRQDWLNRYLERHNLLTVGLNDTEKAAYSTFQHMRTGHDLPDAVEEIYPLLKGAFSCIAMHDDMLVAFRDDHGIRPLALGKFKGDNWAVSSETFGLDGIKANYLRDVEPGEMVILTADGKMESRKVAEGKEKLDLFEIVYFANGDSYLYGNSVNQMRYNSGVQLAHEHGHRIENPDNVLVVPVPDTPIPVAEAFAETLNLRHRMGIRKNPFSNQRIFMLPSSEGRKQNVRTKHNILKEVVRGRDVVLIDDSVVRFDTLPDLVERLESVGARSVIVLIASPPVRFPDFYGIDTPDQEKLIAAQLTVEQMQKLLKPAGFCKFLGFLPLSRLIAATGIPCEKFNTSAFTGEYPIDIGENAKKIRTPVSREYLD